MAAFRDFYETSFRRLMAKAAAYNERLKAEEQAMLEPFFENMADLNEGGKMLRGVLVTLGHQMACRADKEGGRETDEAAVGSDETFDITAADDAALAFEVFQTGVLIHDDIIDRAAIRRGKPTLTVRYENSLKERGIVPPTCGGQTEEAGSDTSIASERAQIAAGTAICAGDYLITASNLILAEAYRSHPQGPAVMKAFCEVILDTIRGELLDVILPAEMADPARSKDEADALLMKAVNEIYHLKTARYSVIGPLHLGMLLGGMPKEIMAAVDEMAGELGAAFQIKDDILGIYADEGELGKDVGSDIGEFKQTILYAYVRLLGGDAYKDLLKYYGKAPVTPEALAAVRKIFEMSGALSYAASEMEKHFARADEVLDSLVCLDKDDRAILRDFIRYNRERRK